MRRLLRMLLLIGALLAAPTIPLAPDEDPREFIPSEKIPADTAIALPVDI